MRKEREKIIIYSIAAGILTIFSLIFSDRSTDLQMFFYEVISLIIGIYLVLIFFAGIRAIRAKDSVLGWSAAVVSLMTLLTQLILYVVGFVEGWNSVGGFG